MGKRRGLTNGVTRELRKKDFETGTYRACEPVELRSQAKVAR
jgi:hypothetical protein